MYISVGDYRNNLHHPKPFLKDEIYNCTHWERKVDLQSPYSMKTKNRIKWDNNCEEIGIIILINVSMISSHAILFYKDI